jgi:hypothetical protein
MNFRRWITALAVLALFAGLASAQVANSGAGTGALACTASVAVPPTLRSEGLTEMAGDIVLTCTGGAAPGYGNIPAAGSSTPIPTANFTVSFGTNVTSRLLSYSTVTPSSQTASNTSEALLLIDEPGSGLAIGPPGYAGGTQNIGPNAPQTPCGSGGSPYSLVGAGNGGCSEYVYNVGGSNVEWVASGSPSSYVPPANMFSGVVSSNQVTFYGIPILPPASAGIARVFRITNVRINANALGGGGLAGTTQVLASISISGSTSVPVNQPVQIAGFIQSGLTVGTRNIGNTGSLSLPNNLNQCSSATTSPVTILRYSENFGTAFKTRVAPTSSYDGQSGYPYLQNIPGAIYNSESGFVTGSIYGISNQSYVGLADYGTRLKAVFNNVPTGVRIFVSTTNVINLTGVSGSGSPYTLGQPAGNSTVSYAQLVISDTAVDGNGTAPTVPAAGYTSPTQTCTTPGCAVLSLNGYAELSVVNNSASAVWEIINTNPATPENFDFGTWVTYTASSATNSPPPGTATVNMSFGPVPPSFTATAGAAASALLTIPRFADMSSPQNIFTIVQCTTSLLFPFITNQAGFDTGFAIMNTTSDPFGTKPQAGTCAFNFYGQNAPPQFITPIIPSGNNTASTTYAFLASSIAPNFEGYAIAVCNFQLAHGYAFVSDLGAQKLAHGYLALILTNAVTSTRTGNPEALEN